MRPSRELHVVMYWLVTERCKPAMPSNNISSLVTVDDVEFLKNGLAKYTSGGNQRFAAMLSFKISPNAWYTSVHCLSPSLKLLAATGVIINS